MLYNIYMIMCYTLTKNLPLVVKTLLVTSVNNLQVFMGLRLASAQYCNTDVRPTANKYTIILFTEYILTFCK